MEKALRYELEKNITELVGNVYPTNAPEGVTKPYLVYARITTKESKTLNGYTGDKGLSYMFSIMATKYSAMKSVADNVEALLKSMALREIGDTEKIYIKEIDINNISETWESALLVNRGIIDFTIYS